MQAINMQIETIPNVRLTHTHRETNHAADKLENEAVEHQQKYQLRQLQEFGTTYAQHSFPIF